MKSLRLTKDVLIKRKDGYSMLQRQYKCKKCLEFYEKRIPVPLSTSVLYYLEQEIVRGSTIVMVSNWDSGSGGPGMRAGRGQCIVFLTKTFYSHRASLHTGIHIGTGKL